MIVFDGKGFEDNLEDSNMKLYDQMLIAFKTYSELTAPVLKRFTASSMFWHFQFHSNSLR